MSENIEQQQIMSDAERERLHNFNMKLCRFSDHGFSQEMNDLIGLMYDEHVYSRDLKEYLAQAEWLLLMRQFANYIEGKEDIKNDGQEKWLKLLKKINSSEMVKRTRVETINVKESITIKGTIGVWTD